jgi:protein dithiol oxidoreductase (disulfide-forming)
MLLSEIRMTRIVAALLCLLALALPLAADAAPWTEGKEYIRLTPPQQTTVPAGKIEVMEVFSYGCPACNAYQPVMTKLRLALPPNAQLVYLPAAFNAAEDWPMFQRAFFAAQMLGIGERAHQAMYDAVWKTGELQTIVPGTAQLKRPQPTIEDAARLYERVAGVKSGDFVAMAKSFAVDSKMRAADTQITAMQVPSTPCLIVNGKYRVNRDALGPSTDQLIELVKFLIAKDSSG